MKNLQLLPCLFCAVFISVSGYAQENKKSHSVGLQLNPYLESFLFEGTFIKPVFAVRYGFNFTDHLSFGPEVSGSFIHHNSNKDMNISDINLGGFVRYSFMSASRVRPFIEASPYYTFHHFKSTTIQTQEGIGEEYSARSFNGYLSPGITLYSGNRKFSLDLMYKFSNTLFVNGHKSVFSYRISYNF
jgi:hypothetical protein